ncbi:MAG: heat shock protein transcriptional repressor HspR [Pontimonas sp.]
MDENTPLFPIATAAELSGLHPQTLRQYDRLGLVSPTRTAGRTRRYSMRDIVALREVQALSAEGLNLEGIKRILTLQKENHELSTRVRQLESALADEVVRRQGRRVFAAGAEGEVIPLRAGERAQRANQVVVWNPLWRMWSEWFTPPEEKKEVERGS